MDKKLFEDFVKTHCVTEEPVWQETVYETEVDPETGLESVVKREVTVKGPLEVIKRRPHIHRCDYCDKTVTDQKIHSRIAQDPVPHWRSRCQSCKSYLHPETQQPIEDQHLSTALTKIAAYWRNKVLGLKQFKEPEQKVKTYTLSSMDTSGREVNSQIEESDHSTITRYFYSSDK